MPITASAAIGRHFRDEQETGLALTVTNWQTQRPSLRDSEEMLCVSVYRQNLCSSESLGSL